MKVVNKLAMEIVYDVLYKDGYSNLGLAKVLRNNELSAQQVGRLTETVYGTLQNKILLESVLTNVTDFKKTKPIVRSLLLVSVYQLTFMGNIPEYTVINASVDVMKSKKGSFLGKFINGVLRNLVKMNLDDVKNSTDLELRYSHPSWIINLFKEAYGEERTSEMVKKHNEPSLLTVRRNRLKCSAEYFEKSLQTLEVDFEKSSLCDESYIIKKGNILGSSLFLDGYCIVQDQSASFVADVLRPKAGERVLDMCAAPGGKTTHLAEYMNNIGEVFAVDKYEHKLDLIEANAKKLGIEIIKTVESDALLLDEFFEGESFDKILLDPPCSGLGLLRRKPEIRYNKSMDEVYELSKIQRKMLDVAGKLLKPGGEIVYSTCTLDLNENSKNIERFMRKHEGQFEIIVEQVFSDKDLLVDDWGATILTNQYMSDGFYVAKIKKTA